MACHTRMMRTREQHLPRRSPVPIAWSTINSFFSLLLLDITTFYCHQCRRHLEHFDIYKNKTKKKRANWLRVSLIEWFLSVSWLMDFQCIVLRTFSFGRKSYSNNDRKRGLRDNWVVAMGERIASFSVWPTVAHTRRREQWGEGQVGTRRRAGHTHTCPPAPKIELFFETQRRRPRLQLTHALNAERKKKHKTSQKNRPNRREKKEKKKRNSLLYNSQDGQTWISRMAAELERSHGLVSSKLWLAVLSNSWFSKWSPRQK